jgi:hypothetical protein
VTGSAGPGRSTAGPEPCGGQHGDSGRIVSAEDGVVDVELADLAAHAGQLVRVSGLIERLATDRLTLDDGTAQADVRLQGEIKKTVTDLHLGSALNVVGRVAHGPAGWEIVPRGPEDLVPAADPALDAAVTEGMPPATRSVMPARVAAAPSPRPSGGPALALLIAGLGLAAMGACVAGRHARRWRTERLFSARMADRLSAVSRRAPAEAGIGASAGGLEPPQRT